MPNIKLYKNKEIVLNHEGFIDNNIFRYENLSFYLDKNILIKEDSNFKYELDFNENYAEVTLKQNNAKFEINIIVNSIVKDNKKIDIEYTIESDENIQNEIVITL